MKNTISQLNNTVEGSDEVVRLNEAEDRINELEEKGEKNLPKRARKGTKSKKQ